MAKRTNTILAFENFEEKATEFISLTFASETPQKSGIALCRHVGTTKY